MTLEELRKIFGFTGRQKRVSIELEAFPIVPLDLLYLIYSQGLRRGCAVIDAEDHNPVPYSGQDKDKLSQKVEDPLLKAYGKPMPKDWCKVQTQSTASTKNDEAQTIMDLWDLRILPFYSLATRAHLNIMRIFFQRVYCKRLLLSYLRYLCSSFGDQYKRYLHERGCKINSASFFNNGRETSFSSTSFSGLLDDLRQGRKVLLHSIGSTSPTLFSEWNNGSQLIHWRWANVAYARDGIPPYLLKELPNNRKKVRAPSKEHEEVIYSKIKKYVQRGYITLTNPRLVQNFIDYFGAKKGNDDIRFVLNGTSCGLSDAVWASNFWLPTSRTVTRLLTYDYRTVDVDIGEMFLNFPLHEELRMHSGLDLTPFRVWLTRDFPHLKVFLSKPRIAAFW